VNEAIGRGYLEDAIRKAQKRNALRAAQDLKMRAEMVRDDAAVLIAQNPFIATGGALALGILLGSMLPRQQMAKGAVALGGLMSDKAVAYGKQMLDKALSARQESETEGADEDGESED